ncbi:hypothetical protein PILCRDRAFT_72747 [Piloderma croceum F 1598]|uniref:Protein N-terminal glutamine amidohydrolase n=1 Tax=Piloderma croceum (strain F 1598) TaxID=765440 RepID=A0A0C3FNI3_PILCF|nr:hypothetical protein PILCRDRAFT_72747 [Piloderma croceum F 1598]
MSLSLVPPPFPPNSLYAEHYCEENIYHLADSFLRQPSIKDAWDIAVVFMSNESKAVALWNQNLAGSADHVIVWDYHVVLILRLRSDVGTGTTNCTVPEGAWIYDYDTLLPKPCPWKGASPMSDLLYQHLKTNRDFLFRVIPADIFFDHFASDRSHMLAPLDSPTYKPDSPYYRSPPPWPVIRGPKAIHPNNLMSDFVFMNTPSEMTVGTGVVLDRVAFEGWCCRSQK